MPRLLRTFVAFRCGRKACERMQREAERLARIDRALRPGAGEFHLTVQFLGETREEDVMPVARAVAQAAAASRPVEVRYGGIGAFPEPSRARVVWVGVAEPTGTLSALGDDLAARLTPLGFYREAREWSPHVTLGRVRSRPSRPLVEAVAAGEGLDLGGETLSDLKLILSEPEGGRPHYVDLATAVLGSRA